MGELSPSRIWYRGYLALSAKDKRKLFSTNLCTSVNPIELESKIYELPKIIN